jgi:glycosyltransferase involved in cell wall biosynthesis
MIIAIDGNEANIDNRVGVHQMAFKILWGLYKLEDKKRRGNQYMVYLKDRPAKTLPPENSFWKYKVLPGGGFWILRCLTPEIIRHSKPDIFFTPSHYLSPFLPIPKVCMITDLGYLKFSGQFRKYDYWQLKYWTAISIIISKYIISISDATRKDIVRHFPFASRKTKTVHLGHDDEFYNKRISEKFVRRTLKKYRITKKYIVFMSTLKPSKNIEGLLDAFYGVRKINDCQLVIVGKKGWFFDPIFEKVKKLGLGTDVIFTGYLKDQERGAILFGARVFVLPSFWEGFGIDVLNAFSCGVPVVVSNVASLPEVAGKAGIYIDPNDTLSISKGVEKVLNMKPEEYNSQVRLGFNQLEKFSWEKSAEEVLKVLEDHYK